MTDVAQANRQHPGFPYTPDELRLIAAGVRNEGYPPQGRHIRTSARKAG